MRDFMDQVGWPLFWGFVAICLIGFLSFLAVNYDGKQRILKLQAAYPVWCKQTGNPQKLTFEEWKTLMIAQSSLQETKNNTVMIPLIINR